MADVYAFRPVTRTPVIIQVTILVFLLSLGAFGFWQFSRAQIGPAYLVYLLTGIAALSFAPLLVYRLYALYRAEYFVERDGIRLQWGLRVEEIPMDRIEWVHPVKELEGKLPLPAIRWPGAVLGTRRLPDATLIEFLASSIDNLILISLGDRYFAISPSDPQGFIAAYQNYTELGSLSPLPSRSIYPSFLLARFWSEKTARYLFLSGLILLIVLLGWVMMIIPSQAEVPLRLDPTGAGLEPAPSIMLLLIPVLASLLFATDILGGLFFFRRPEGRVTAFLFWAAGVLTLLLFLLAVGFIQRAM